MVGKAEMKYSTYERTTGLIKSRFEKIKTQVDGIAAQGEPPTPVQMRTMASYLVEIKTKRRDFENNLLRVIETVTDEEATQDDLSSHQDAINDLYVYICSVIETLSPPEVPPSPSATSVSDVSQPAAPSHVRLPKLELKRFDGNPSQWTSFINLFDASVHKNPSVTNTAKFQYLLGVLSGEPLALIQSLNITTGNYIVAYKLLRDRYHNVRRLQSLHLNNLLDLPQISATSPKSLRMFLNSFLENTQALKALDCDITTEKNPLFSAMILRKMDVELRKKLESYRSSLEQEAHTLPQVQDMIDFLNQECTHVEDASLHMASGTSYKPHPHSSSSNINKSNKKSVHLAQPDSDVVMFTSGSTPAHTKHNKHSEPCFDCSKVGHKIYACPSYKEKTPKQRYQLVKQHRRCISCLGKHSKSDCKSKINCFVCHKPHHTTLHFEGDKPAPSGQTSHSGKPQANPSNAVTQQQNLAPVGNTTATNTTQVVMTSQHHVVEKSSPNVDETPTTVLLGTTLIKLTSPNGSTHVFRGLLDSGSMLDFISERAAQLLGAPRSKSTANILGIGQTSSQSRGCTQLHIASLSGHEVAAHHTFHILDKISANLPRTQIDPKVFTKVKGYTLADPTFHLPGSIDILLGGSLYPQLFTQERHSLGPQMPYILGSHFGFIVMGKAPCIDNTPSATSHMSLLSTSDYDLHSSLMKFWEQEELPTPSKQSEDELLCDQHFVDTHSRDNQGRYIVRLPFRANHPPLGASKLSAERRLASLENKLHGNPHFHEAYSKFMNDYQIQGHMTKLANFDAMTPHYFLPHHGVLKESSSTTKLRVVFDGSSKTSSGVSINDILLTGRKLQTNICDILLQFRARNVVFSADIRAMYRMVQIHPDDRMHQLILWREHPSHEIGIFQLNTVTYGLNSSPYHAIRTLRQLADDEGSDYPEAAKVLTSQTYVDDILAGSDTVEEALRLQSQLIDLLKRGGFELRKWSSNHEQLLQIVPTDHRETPVFLETSQQPHFSILGLHWSPTSDTFTYHLNFPENTPTKRNVLSLIAKIYDPCGFLSPCVMLAKCFMQLLWASGLSWDDKLPPDLSQKWLTFVSDAKNISQIQIPRAFRFSQSTCLELHGFSDASESGFAAVVYFRCQLSSGDVIVRQVIAKTRVAPLKRVTLPRLELCAAHLLAQLITYVMSTFKDKVDFANTFLWCDSSVVLTWLQTPSYRLKTYVANRVSLTQELIPSTCWRYIESSQNPADCASRGILASELLHHPLWWSGPGWLTLPSNNWPTRRFTPLDISDSEETKKTPLTVLVSTPRAEWDLLVKFSSWRKLQLVLAFVLRFIYNCKHRGDRRQGYLTTQELKHSKLQLFKLVQHAAFEIDIDHVQHQRPCTTRLQRLNPFIDDHGLLRVGGRLSKTSLPDDVRHPVILPKNHHIVDILIDHYHASHLHAGAQLTQALLHQDVWILSARSVIRSRIFKCVKCFRVKPHNDNPLMGDLPQQRVHPARPFSQTGTDYCGPFNVKVFNLRAVRHVKVYLCVFVCLVTKAVHLEVVTDLTTEAFIASLTRFVSRRGLCSDIFSDCGTNFVGADSVLRKLLDNSIFSAEQRKEIHYFTVPQGIKFHFNPPSAPHQGGLWEAAVKSAKYHLRRVMGDTVLTLMEFITLATQIEAMLNSRPLTALSSDASDLATLTPGHFLIGAPLAAVPEQDLQDVPDNRLKRWQLVQAFNQRIWKRWQLEYLHTLQQRLKWIRPSKNLEVGDLVLVHTHTATPLSWPLARITAVHPGADGVVRVVDLKTQFGTLTRPAVKVYPLPMN